MNAHAVARNQMWTDTNRGASAALGMCRSAPDYGQDRSSFWAGAGFGPVTPGLWQSCVFLPRSAVANYPVRRHLPPGVDRQTGRGFGRVPFHCSDIDNAMQRLEARYGLPFWSLWHLRKGKAKTVEASLLAKIKGAYLDMCQRQASNLLHEIEIEVASGDDTDLDLAEALRALATKIESRKTALK
jgi:hypothetical protein